MINNTLFHSDSSVVGKKASKRKFPTAKSERAENDYYATDPIAARLLLQREQFDNNVWECASGENHLADIFKEYGYNVRTSDIVKRTPSTEVLDFLCNDVKHWDGDIITNPPYAVSQEFVEKALSIIPIGNKVAMFLRLQFLEGLGRYELFKNNPPKVVYVSCKRIRCGKDGDFNTASSSITAYAWFVWEKGYKGSPRIEWINHNEAIETPVLCATKQKEIPEGKAYFAPIYAHHELSDKDVLTKRHRVNMRVKGRKLTLYVQRVSSSIYERFGFSQYHYIDKPINKGAACLLFTDKKNRPIAFVGLLNHTFKGCHNGIMVSRFVIMPKFQKRGLSIPILESVGAMLSACGYQLYFNTQNERLGEAIGRRKSFVGTTYDKQNRDGRYDKTHRNRTWGKAWRKKYVGRKLYGYSELAKKVAVLRGRSVGSETDKQKGHDCKNQRVACNIVLLPLTACNRYKTAHISLSDSVSTCRGVVNGVAASRTNTSNNSPIIRNVSNALFNTS